MITASQQSATTAARQGMGAILAEVASVDQAVYAAIARTETPTLDRALRLLSESADHSKLSLGIGAVLAATGGARGRRAALSGLASVAVTQAVVNAAIKPLGRRRRPDRAGDEVPVGRHVPMPGSRSFPSGHTSGAVAFAHGVARVMPWAGVPLYSLAALVGYSRVHTGVHYPGDVLGGAVIGAMVSDVTAGMVVRRTRPRERLASARESETPGAGHSSASKS